MRNPFRSGQIAPAAGGTAPLSRWHSLMVASTAVKLSVMSCLLMVIGFVLIFCYAFGRPGAHLSYAAAGVLVAFASLGSGALLGFLFGIPRVVSSGEARFNKPTPPPPTTTTTTTSPDITTTTTTDPATPLKAKTVAAAAAAAPVPVPAAPPASPPDASTGSTDSSDQPPFAPSTNLAEVSDWLTKLLLGAGLVSLTKLGKPIGDLIDAVARGITGADAKGVISGTAPVMAGGIMLTYLVLGFLGGYVLTTLSYSSTLVRQSVNN